MHVRKLLRGAIARAIRWSGMPALARRMHREGSIVVLLYHDPHPAVFARHLAFLAERYRFTTLDVVVDAIHARDASRLPEHGLVVTLDDGHRRNFDLLPLFQQYRVRPTIYLCSQIAGEGRNFWFQYEGLDASRYKRLSNRDRLAALRRDVGFDPLHIAPEARQDALSADQIRKMAPWVDFGAHTRFHPILTQCDSDEAWDEIRGSKEDLETHLGQACRHFAYPNGDYSLRELEMVRRAGFSSGRTTDLGWTTVESDPLRLRVFGVTDDASIDMLDAQLSGIPGYLRRLVSGGRHGLSPTRLRADLETNMISTAGWKRG